MKFTRNLIPVLAMVLGAGLPAFAQSSNHVPGPADYSAFSQFITDRNIFDPNRQPHSGSRTRTYTRPATHSASAPAFSLVGTMAYEKGMFAFFNGNSDELKQALYVSGKIAGYTVAQIDYGRVTLEGTNQTNTVELKVGDVMREENGAWRLTGPGDVAGLTDASGGNSSSNSSSSSRYGHFSRYGHDGYSSGAATGNSASANSTPPSAAEQSDILKRLMEKREQENQ